MVKVARRKSRVLALALTPEEKALDRIERASRAPAAHLSESSRFDLELLPDIFDPDDMSYQESLCHHRQFRTAEDVPDEHGVVVEGQDGTCAVVDLDPVDTIAQEIYARTGDSFFAVA